MSSEVLSITVLAAMFPGSLADDAMMGWEAIATQALAAIAQTMILLDVQTFVPRSVSFTKKRRTKDVDLEKFGDHLGACLHDAARIQP